jgi:hypothetical protein
MITQITINQQNKSFSSLQGKSRLDSLIDRIQSANKEINTILETPIQTKKEEKTQKEIDESKKEEKPLKTLDQKIVENDNNKSVQVGLDDNENNQEINENKEDNKDNNTVNQDNQENPENPETQINNNNDNQNQEQEKKNINLDVEIPFVKKIKKMLNELKTMKEKPGITEEEINNNVSELPKRAMVEMSLSDFKIKKKYESIKKQLDEKNNYIKKLENEIVNQRILNNNLKKSEGEHLLKISALEDELRVMKLKLLGYNTSEELNIHNHQQYKTDANNCGHIYGEKLVHSMWVRGNNTPNNNINNNNFDLDNSRPILNKGERWRAPWISQSQGNINRMVMRNINKNLYNNENIHTRTENKLGYEFGEKNNFDNNNRYESFKSNNNNNFNGGGNNFQRVSGMILENSNKIKLTKNFSNEFNRFRIGNNNNNIINKNTNSNNSYFK